MFLSKTQIQKKNESSWHLEKKIGNIFINTNEIVTILIRISKPVLGEPLPICLYIL